MKLQPMKKAAAVLLAALTAFLCGCRGNIAPSPIVTETDISSDQPAPNVTPDDEEKVVAVGRLYRSYLTMHIGPTPLDTLGLPYYRVFTTHQQISDYYSDTYQEFLYGNQFVLAMGSFSDEFLKDTDVMVVVINEPSSYVNHTAEPIVISEDSITVNITRHISENAPLSETQYHLIFTAPKGEFSRIGDRKLNVNISEIIDPENNSAFDADSFRLYYPEFVSGDHFTYRTDALTDSPSVTVDAIDGYEELVYFYDTYREAFDLDTEFRDNIGTLYNWEICQRYIILATIIPVSGLEKPEVTELFVNNLEIYITIDANQPEDGEPPDACYLVFTALERSDLQGVDLSYFNINIE